MLFLTYRHTMNALPRIIHVFQQMSYKTLKQLMDDDWGIYTFKMFLRLQQTPEEQSHTLFMVKSYQVAMKLHLSEQHCHENAQELIHYLNRLEWQVWSNTFYALTTKTSTVEDYQHAANYLKNELITAIEISQEYQEFRIVLAECVNRLMIAEFTRPNLDDSGNSN